MIFPYLQNAFLIGDEDALEAYLNKVDIKYFSDPIRKSEYKNVLAFISLFQSAIALKKANNFLKSLSQPNTSQQQTQTVVSEVGTLIQDIQPLLSTFLVSLDQVAIFKQKSMLLAC